MKFGVGQSVKRVEDFRLLTGAGRYTDDLQLPGTLFAVTLRSPYGHAADPRHRHRTGAGGRRRCRGLYLRGHQGLWRSAVPGAAVGPDQDAAHLLAADRVRFVGDGVAFVIAEPAKPRAPVPKRLKSIMTSCRWSPRSTPPSRRAPQRSGPMRHRTSFSTGNSAMPKAPPRHRRRAPCRQPAGRPEPRRADIDGSSRRRRRILTRPPASR